MSHGDQEPRTEWGTVFRDVLAVSYVTGTTVAALVLYGPMLLIAAIANALKLHALTRRWSMLWLLATTAVLVSLIVAGEVKNPWTWPALGLLAYLSGASYRNAVRMPPRPEDYLRAIDMRWPDRWFAHVLKDRVNAIFIRHIIGNSVVMAAALVALALPSDVSYLSVSFYFLALLLVTPHHERLDHTDIHNRNFRSSHLTGIRRWIVRLTELYLRWVLNPMCGRIPHFYRAQHVFIHHVENNGPADVQTTVHGDRTSFFHFCACALRFGLSWCFGIDVMRYLYRARRVECWRLLAGFALWFCMLGLLAVHNPGAALVLLAARFMSGLPVAVYTFFWHGLVDVEDVDNVYRSSIDLVSPDLAGSANLHIRHHRYSGEHWSRQNNADEVRYKDRWRNDEPVLIRVDANPVLFVSALLTRRFDLIAKLVVPVPGHFKSQPELEELVRRRTVPLAEHASSRMRQSLDRVFARWYGSILWTLARRKS